MYQDPLARMSPRNLGRLRRQSRVAAAIMEGPSGLTWRQWDSNPCPLLAKSPTGFRERLIEHAVGRCGVPDHAVLVTHCSTSLGYFLEDSPRVN